MSLATASGAVASIVPFDPTVGITVVATVMLALFVLVMVFLAVAPVVSAEWTERLGASSSGAASVDATEAD